MDIHNFTPIRRAIYDRESIVVGSDFFATVAPHSVTVRDTFIVPDNRKLCVGFTSIFVERDANASTDGLTVAAIKVEKVDNSIVIINRFSDHLPARHEHVLDAGYQGLVLLAGDKIIIETEDPSIGGLIVYDMYWSGNTFDI